MTATNIIIDHGGSNEVTINTTKFTENFTKKLTVITPPQSTGNRSNGPKQTKVVDLLRIEQRYSIRGYIEASNRVKLKTIYLNGGSTNWLIYEEDVMCNMEKLTIDTNPTDKAQSNEDDDLEVTIDGVMGIDI